MKFVVQYPPDQVELVLHDLEQDHFMVDQDTYCHFRDAVFIKGIENFIKKTAPKKWKEMENLEGAEKVETWFDNQELIYKHYRSFKKHQSKFHVYRNGIYFYELIGFANVGTEIKLMKLEIEDVVVLLNKSTESVLKKLLRMMTT